ncbi:type VI secretion system tube protein TssD [Xenorhabdus sp. PB62.4]|uniref:type VI secretion system tube protein TssD n=1 Tax=Xenorhabdus sp. PB62.4 TaxID=1851573 RepID=UPI001657464D|nr:hypothetical protein [Xenorhabdus sp. PB62.4]
MANIIYLTIKGKKQGLISAGCSTEDSIDKATPLLGVTISDNEELECTFDIYRTDSNGGLSLYFTIKVTNATISNINVICPNSLTHNDAQPQEIISFKYKSITWQHHLAGTSGYSIWDERVY